MNIGSILRGYRKRQKLTQAELARRAGVTVTTISNTETGRSEPTLAVLVKLAKGFGIGLSRFLDIVPGGRDEDR